mgnify:CR=1 FL=1
MFRILSTGSALPALSKTNDDLSTFLDTSDEWISQRTGIRQRSLCSDETLTDLLTVAAKQALERAGVEPQQLDLILCATIRGRIYYPVAGVCDSAEAGCRLSCDGYFRRRVTGVCVCAGCGSQLFCQKEGQEGAGAGRRHHEPPGGLERPLDLCAVRGRCRRCSVGRGRFAAKHPSDGKRDPQVLCIPQPQSNSPFDILPPQQPFCR